MLLGDHEPWGRSISAGSELSVLQNLTPQKWVVKIRTVCIYIYLHANRKTDILFWSQFDVEGEPKLSPMSCLFLPFKKPSESLRWAKPGLGRSCRPGLVGKRHPFLGPVWTFLGPLVRSTMVHPHSQKDHQEQSTGSSRIFWILSYISI